MPLRFHPDDVREFRGHLQLTLLVFITVGLCDLMFDKTTAEGNLSAKEFSAQFALLIAAGVVGLAGNTFRRYHVDQAIEAPPAPTP